MREPSIRLAHMMTQGFTMDDVSAIYDAIAPAAFAKFGVDPVPFVTAPHGWWTPPNEWDILMQVFGGGNIALAETGFVPHEDAPTFTGELAPTARPLFIAVNPYYLPGLFEDEVIAALLHEIAHAAGIWSDQHNSPWEARALAFGTAPAQPLFSMRDWSAHPYHGDTPPCPPTLDQFQLIVP